MAVGEALHIKENDWNIKSSPAFFFHSIIKKSHSIMKVSVKKVGSDYYVIRKA